MPTTSRLRPSIRSRMTFTPEPPMSHFSPSSRSTRARERAADRSFIPGATCVGYDRGMRLSRIPRAVFVAACLLAASVRLVSAQSVATGHETSADSVASYALSQQMPVDPEVLVGALANGLRFYVRPNGKPAREAELRLVIRAGSVLEDDDQRGLAHFVEHMEFQGTRHFPGEGINAFLGALGLSIGADANAATSFDETEYMLRVPTEKPEVLARALTVLDDCARSATFDQAAIERQRAIVLAEWRMNLGASERVGD